MYILYIYCTLIYIHIYRGRSNGSLNYLRSVTFDHCCVAKQKDFYDSSYCLKIYLIHIIRLIVVNGVIGLYGKMWCIINIMFTNYMLPKMYQIENARS